MNTFKSQQSTGITTSTGVFSGSVDAQSIIIGMSIANTSSVPVYADVKINSAFMVKQAPIPVGGALVVVGSEQKVVVETTDSVSVASTGTVDVTLSILEISA